MNVSRRENRPGQTQRPAREKAHHSPEEKSEKKKKKRKRKRRDTTEQDSGPVVISSIFQPVRLLFFARNKQTRRARSVFPCFPPPRALRVFVPPPPQMDKDKEEPDASGFSGELSFIFGSQRTSTVGVSCFFLFPRPAPLRAHLSPPQVGRTRSPHLRRREMRPERSRARKEKETGNTDRACPLRAKDERQLPGEPGGVWLFFVFVHLWGRGHKHPESTRGRETGKHGPCSSCLFVPGKKQKTNRLKYG